MLVVGRTISGIFICIASAIVSVYQFEIAPKETRGRIVALQQWAITWGILIQYFIHYGESFVGGGPNDHNQPELAFRLPWGMQMFPAVLFFVGLFFPPRSPRWLATKDMWDEAIQVLADLHADGDMDHPKVPADYQEIQGALRLEREEATSSMRTLAAPAW
jgi:MFS family permease